MATLSRLTDLARWALDAPFDDDAERIADLLGRVLRAIARESAGAGSANVARHPLVKLLLYRLAGLAGLEVVWSDEAQLSACHAALRLAMPGWRHPAEWRQGAGDQDEDLEQSCSDERPDRCNQNSSKYGNCCKF